MDNLDVKVFKKLITQVAFETMEQFQTKFDHISTNSITSANFVEIEEMDDQ